MGTRRGSIILGVIILMLTACASDEGVSNTTVPTADTSQPSAPVTSSTPTTSARATTSTQDPEASLACENPDVTVTISVASLSYTALYVAKNAGLFEDHGLNVTVLSTEGGGPDLVALLAGDAEFNSGLGSYQIDALSQGQPLRSVYVLLKGTPISLVLSNAAAEEANVTADSLLTERIEALRGRTIAATRPGSATFQAAELILRTGGMDPATDAEVVGLGGGSVLLTALSVGQVDAIIMTPPIMEQAVFDGLGIKLISIPNGDIPELDPLMGQVIYTRDDYIQEHPGCVARFVAAVHEANQLVLESDASEIVPLVAPDFEGVAPEVLLDSVETIKAATSSDGQLTTEMIQNTLGLKEGDKPSVDEVMGLFTEEFLP